MSISRAATTSVDVPRGLAGVVVTDTELGDVRGLEGFYHYRQYSAVELAQARGFEDVWHLLVHGELPDAVQRAEFAGRTAELRRLPDEVRAALPAIAAATGHSGALAGLRTALSLLGASLGFRPVYDIDSRAASRGHPLRVRGRAHVAHRAVPARAGAGAGGATRGSRIRRQLPLHVDWFGTGRCAYAGDRAIPHLNH